MAKANEAKAPEAVDETPKAIRPNDLAKELQVDGKSVRAFLRKEFPRPSDAKNTNWFLTDQQVKAVREAFTPSDDEEVDELVEA